MLLMDYAEVTFTALLRENYGHATRWFWTVGETELPEQSGEGTRTLEYTFTATKDDIKKDIFVTCFNDHSDNPDIPVVSETVQIFWVRQYSPDNYSLQYS